MIIYCDNDSVCDTIEYRKPRDPTLLSLLREFLHIVVAKKFFPVVRKIGTKENALADHISRRYDSDAAEKMFETNGLQDMVKIKPRAQFYNMSANWSFLLISAQGRQLQHQNILKQGQACRVSSEPPTPPWQVFLPLDCTGAR